MIQRTRDLMKLFQRDERGQAMVITAILALVLFRCVMASYNTGVAINARIRGQTVADAAAFSGAIWQARFLNYCAYTRRAIIANYAHIGLLNANIVNKMALDNIIDANDLWITAYQDRGLISKMGGLKTLKFMRDLMVPVQGKHGKPKTGNMIPNVVDGQHVAEHMNVLLSESQVALHAVIFPIEGVMNKIIQDSCIEPGEIVQATLSHAAGGNLFPGNSFTDQFAFLTMPLNAGLMGGALGVPDIPVFNMLPKGLVYRDKNKTRIPLDEIRPLFEHGHTKVSHPLHWGLQVFQGRPYFGIGIPPLNNPDWLKIVNVNTMPLPWFGGDTTLTASGNKARYRTREDGFYGFPGMLGQYLWFYLKIDTPFGPIIIWIATPILGNGEKFDYTTKHDIVHVYEVRDEIKNSTDYHLLEPRVYSAIAMRHGMLPYFRPNPAEPSRHLNLLSEAGDIVCISSAKVYFQPFGANELTRIGAYPDTHYPFYGAKLATIKDGGRRRNALVGPGRLLIESSRNPLDWLYGVSVAEEAGFSALGYYPNY